MSVHDSTSRFDASMQRGAMGTLRGSMSIDNHAESAWLTAKWTHNRNNDNTCSLLHVPSLVASLDLEYQIQEKLGRCNIQDLLVTMEETGKLVLCSGACANHAIHS